MYVKPGQGQYIGGPSDVLRDFAPNSPFQLLQTLAPVTRLGASPLIIVVPASAQIHSLRELINLAKGKPQTVTYASSGPGGVTNLVGELFKITADVNLVHIPYKSQGAEVPDLLAGRVTVAFEVGNIIGAHLKSGKVRALAITSSTHLAAFPDIPTTLEAGLPGFEATVWSGIFVPVGTPDAIIRLLHRELARALESPEIKDQIVSSGSYPGGEPPEQFAAFLRAESLKFGRVIKTAGIKLE